MRAYTHKNGVFKKNGNIRLAIFFQMHLPQLQRGLWTGPWTRAVWEYPKLCGQPEGEVDHFAPPHHRAHWYDLPPHNSGPSLGLHQRISVLA